MQYPNRIKTIKGAYEFQFKEKGSQFIGYAEPCDSEEKAENILTARKKQFYDATHNCFAYKILPETIKYSDDGEPSGTAGIRILNAIQHNDLTNLIVVSTRYYGGTKLGVGPLGKAYYNSADGVLNAAKVITKINYSLYDIYYDFEFTKSAHHFLNTYNCIIQENSFDERPIISFLIKPEDVELFTVDVKNASQNKVTVKKRLENLFIDYK